MAKPDHQKATVEVTYAIAARLSPPLLGPPTFHDDDNLYPTLQWGTKGYENKHLASYDGETRKFDPRCPYCVWRWSQQYNQIIASIP